VTPTFLVCLVHITQYITLFFIFRVCCICCKQRQLKSIHVLYNYCTLKKTLQLNVYFFICTIAEKTTNHVKLNVHINNELLPTFFNCYNYFFLVHLRTHPTAQHHIPEYLKPKYYESVYSMVFKIFCTLKSLPLLQKLKSQNIVLLNNI
jgi:hypothetical protein